MTRTFSAMEEKSLKAQLADGENPACPRCGGSFQITPIVRPKPVSYVRRRVLLICQDCGRRVAMDLGRV